jgi:hypothetical protein
MQPVPQYQHPRSKTLQASAEGLKDKGLYAGLPLCSEGRYRWTDTAAKPGSKRWR